MTLNLWVEGEIKVYPGRFGLAVLSSTESSGFDVLGKMVQIKEMTEHNPSLSGIDCGKSIFGEGTVSIQPRREGESIAIATARPVKCVSNTMPQALFHRARLGNEEMGHFPTQKLAKIKRVGYRCRKIEWDRSQKIYWDTARWPNAYPLKHPNSWTSHL